MDDSLDFLNNNQLFQKEEIFTNFLNFKRKVSDDSLSEYLGRSLKNENSLKPNFCMFSKFNQDDKAIEDISNTDKNDSIYILNSSLRHGLSLIDEKSFMNSNMKNNEFNTSQNEMIFNINIKEKNKKGNLNTSIYNKNSSILEEKNQYDTNLTIETNENFQRKNKKTIFKAFDIEEQKKKKLLMNRLSAKKSRIKKKEYLLELEEKYLKMKKELSFNENDNTVSVINKKYKKIKMNKDIETPNYIESKNPIVQSYNDLEKKDKDIITSKNCGNINLINDYASCQEKFLTEIFVQNFQYMMPIKLKIFQNKYLKIQKINTDDDFDTIISKINENIEMIKDLYSFEKEDIILQNKKNDSTSYQLYCYYLNTRNYVMSYKSLINLLTI